MTAFIELNKRLALARGRAIAAQATFDAAWDMMHDVSEWSPATRAGWIILPGACPAHFARLLAGLNAAGKAADAAVSAMVDLEDEMNSLGFEVEELDLTA